jgi:ABC-type branched-subunit amino acid transport system ATPase component
MEPLLSVQGVSKNFIGIKALENINVRIGRNERVGLIGDNGAGKSTLIKIISGIYSPDAGDIYWEGDRVLIDSPATSRRLGIETIYQDLSLADNLTTTNNFFLGREFTVSGAGGVASPGRPSSLLLEGLHARRVYYFTASRRQLGTRRPNPWSLDRTLSPKAIQGYSLTKSQRSLNQR